jgi:hypothetical protein
VSSDCLSSKVTTSSEALWSHLTALSHSERARGFGICTATSRCASRYLSRSLNSTFSAWTALANLNCFFESFSLAKGFGNGLVPGRRLGTLFAKTVDLTEHLGVVRLQGGYTIKMSTDAKRTAVEELWQQALQTYREDGLRGRLAEGWPGDSNVNERITYEYPPTFQPGYVGSRYFASGRRMVLVGQNPGEGSDPTSIGMNREYRTKLEGFARGEIGFEDLNRLIGAHMLRWSVFHAKGIFREGGAAKMSLLDDDVRPSIRDIGYVNYFPFKTSENRPPLKASSFRVHSWTTYVGRLLELLEPSVIVPMGAWCTRSVEAELRGLAGSPEVIAVWHPSNYNANTRPQKLRATWEPLSGYLRELL